MRYTTRQGGYITLISVLVVGAVGAAVTISLLMFGLSASRSSFAFEQSAQARGLADACAEQALLSIHDTNTCAGDGSVSFGQGSCVAVVTGDGTNCTVNATGTVGTIVRRAKIILSSVSPVIVKSSWREVADF